MKNFIIILTIILAAALALFWRQVWDIFAGMSVLESMNTIVTFILHVAVATIAAYAAVTLPEFIKPWIKAFRHSKKLQRRNRGNIAPQPKAPVYRFKMPKEKNQPVYIMQTGPDSSAEETPIRLDF